MTAEMPNVDFGTVPSGASTSSPLGDPRALQILTTEHWSLLSSRSLSYNEAFSRAGMFLTFLSATLIVIGFLISSPALSDAVLPVTGLLLAVDLFIGLATIGRLASAATEEFTAIRGMNRIRHAYAEMVPGLERYFVSPIHDDARGVLSTFGDLGGHSGAASLAHGLTTTLGMLMVVNSVLLGALLGIIGTAIGAAAGVAIGLGILGFAALFGAFAIAGMKIAMRAAARPPAMFPTPTGRRED